ncbi:Prolipoprotein diacylglyceryl transferase [Syntrophus gentianae]|uniref:Prolipoprotein diacylglyceryl transferase n=1 Tax=Syntrophus gentianae TaxID=43775 RepID=A0A1H7XTX2_9BACT|nr:prolipoprotein diacylglyceryl transferase [Syntrophus gentianae]SEM37326.1 Prolipoprotein diacylglyceryl transferase [Syntrophus gentianae]
MHPILFKIVSYPVYSYGFFIAMGVMSGFLYTYWQGKRQFGMTFDQTYALFFLLVLVGGIGGKAFVLFEDPLYFLQNPQKLLSGTGFVFYGTLLLTIPTMLWYFKKIKIPIPGMLDIMAVVGCIMHIFGRTGCFLAGCCHGKPTDSIFGVTFTDRLCQAEPLNTPLHPTQLYEVAWIAGIMAFLIFLKSRKTFDGQIFLIYLMAYGAGRGVIEFFRGDDQRGFLFGNIISTSQFISILIIAIAAYFYFRMNKKRAMP